MPIVGRWKLCKVRSLVLREVGGFAALMAFTQRLEVVQMSGFGFGILS